MRDADDVRTVAGLAASGLTTTQIAAATGIPRSTVRNWLNGRSRTLETSGSACPRCRQRCLPIADAATGAYAYLLGQYLGDGGIYRHRRDVFRLVIFGDARYPAIAAEVRAAISTVMPQVTAAHQLRGAERTCITTYAYSRSWPCLFPQHGAGHKHLRPIGLADWQRALTHADPEALIRGLLHSDGCRATNRSGRRAYTRYQFSNRSDDIRAIFCEHLDLLAIPWRRMNRWTVSVARREGVARLDQFVGPKR